MGVIGIISAITIPNLIIKYQKFVTANQVKVAYGIFSEAIKFAKLDFGQELPISEDMVLEMWMHSPSFSEVYIDPYLKGAFKYNGKRIEIRNKSHDTHFIHMSYFTNNPMCLPNNLCYWVSLMPGDGDLIRITVDLNGPKGPNVAGNDVFAFILELNSTKTAATNLTFPDMDKSQDIIRKSCADEATYSRPGTANRYFNGLTCSTLIFQNGWKISDDYYW